MIDASVIIGLLARDCVESLKHNIPRIELLGSYFTSYNVVIYENDSIDGTTEAIKQWAAENDKVVAICEKRNSVTIPAKSGKCAKAKSLLRIEKMVNFRNILLGEVRKHFSPTYYIQIDVDIEEFDPASVVSAITDAPADWGALYANGHFVLGEGKNAKPAPFQYDSFAFLNKGIDYRKTKNWIATHDFHKITAYVADLLISKADYLPCSSAFNGIGVYKWDVVKDIDYRVYQTAELEEVGACFCEHIPYNGDILERGYSVYVTSKMQVTYYHQKDTLLNKLVLWKKCMRAQLKLWLNKKNPEKYELFI